ncbi:MAG: TetR/AcrR family transcriptional regulator C-terminal domain-containing protein [Planctomycetes bacterium]|nr:TetR/AcrR family transcriptional regulator C-terminal domain-containing protein [Planctomycetota bacterium]
MDDLPATAPKRRRRPRQGPGRPAAGETLTQAEIANAALQLILAEGEAALTMRRLGEVLGVKAMALYNHFADKEAILDAVAALALTRLPAPPTKGAWQTRLKAICHGVRSLARQQPGVFRVAMSRPTPPTNAWLHIESVLAALADGGLPPAAQVAAYNTLRLYVQAFCLWEIEAARHRQDAEGLARTAAPYPLTTAALPHLVAPDLDRQFEAGLDLILRGLRATMER